MARKIEVQLLGDSRDLDRAFRSGASSGSEFGRRMRTVAKAATAAGVVIAGAFAAASIKGVKAASDLNEETSKSRVLFGRSSAAILKWSKTTAASIGLSARAALSAAGNFGGMFAALRLGDRVSAGMSKRLVKLGADLASFSNQSPEEMLDRLRSGLAGEAEPLRRFGIFISAARVQQEALRTGIAKTGQELTEQQKVQARYSLILRDSAKAQGDFARTSGSFANQQRIARAQLENTAASLGRIFLPAATAALKEFNSFIEDMTKARTVRAKVNVVLDRLKGLADRLTTRLVEAVRAIDWSAVWSKARGIADGLQKQLEEVDFDFVGERIGQSIRDAVDVALPAAKEIGQRLTRAIRAIDFSGLGKRLGPELAAALVSAFVTLTDPVFWIRNWDAALAIALVAFTGPIGRFAGKAAGEVVILLTRSLSRIAPALGEAFRGLAIQSVRLFGAGLQLITPMLGNLLKRVGGVFGRLGKIATFVVKVLGVTAAINAVVDFSKSVIRLFKRLGRTIGDAFEEGWKQIKIGALNTALFILKSLDFTVFGRHIIPGVHKLVQGITAQLALIKSGAKTQMAATQRAIDNLHGKEIEVTITTKLKTEVVSGSGTVRPVRESGDPTKKAVNDAQTRAANAASDAQITTAKAIAAARRRSARIAKAAAAAAAKAKEEAIDAFNTLMDTLDLGLERAQRTTRNMKDDLAILRKQELAILEEVKIEGRTVELERRLDSIRQQRVELRKNMRKQSQFLALGLTAEGDTPTPSAGALLRRAKSLQESIKGTPLDTSKTRTQLRKIVSVLKNNFKTVGREVREAILQMLEDISGATTQSQGPLTKTHGLNTLQIIKGLDLTTEQKQALRSRLADFNTAGLALAGSGKAPTGSFSAPSAQFEVHTTVNLDGSKVASNTTKHQQKDRRRNPTQKRGPNGTHR